MHSLVPKVFDEELTEEGLRELRGKYPSEVVWDMSDDKQFKQARKVRTERNKLVESVNRKRIDVTSDLKAYADNLSGDINSALEHIIEPFEAEDARRKEAAARIKREYEERLNGERAHINDIRSFVTRSRGQDSEYIEGVIESVDLIDTDCFHKDLIHDAITAKRETMEQLTGLLADTKAREKLEAEQAKIRAEQAKLDADRAEMEAWKSQKAEAEAKAQREAEQADMTEQNAREAEQQDINHEQAEEVQPEPQAQPANEVVRQAPKQTHQLSMMEIQGIKHLVGHCKAINEPYAARLAEVADQLIEMKEAA